MATISSISLQLPTRYRAFGTVVDIAIGLLLIVAAILKLLSPSETAAIQWWYQISPFILIVAIQVELTLGALLVLGERTRLIWRVIGVLFSAFALFSLYRAIAGFDSCGCFGSVKTNPWITLFVDAAVAGWALLRQRSGFSGAVSSPYGFSKIAVALSMSALISATLGSGLSLPKPTETIRESIAAHKFVVLDPESWLAKSFPLNDVIAPQSDLSQGDWTIVFFHHDCPKCQEILPAYERKSMATAETLDMPRLLLVEIPPFAEGDLEHRVPQHARLPDDVDWFMQTPTEVRVQDGLVTHVSHPDFQMAESSTLAP